MTKTLNLPVENIEYLIAQGGGIVLEGEDVAYSGTIDTENDAALLYISPGISTNHSISFQIVDETEPSSRTAIGLEVGIGLAVLAVAGFGIFCISRENRRIILPEAAGRLLTKIANLDDDYEAGNLQNIHYQKKRQALIEKIKQTT